MTNTRPDIIYTYTDEAPALATYSLLLIIQTFAEACGRTVDTRDISLAGRIIAAFSDQLKQEQQIPDALAELGELAKKREANIIKLPNISASIPQLKAAITELQKKGYALPNYPDEPVTDDQKAIRKRYDKVKGSAVNPVLREGNSDRRVPNSVKQYARKNPHSMGAWSPDSRSHVATMTTGDFRSTERSTAIPADGHVRIELTDPNGDVSVLKDRIPVLAGEVIDAAVMRVRSLKAFLETEVEDAQSKGVLFSIHLKATMMKVSDPIIFGHAVKVFFRDLFQKHGAMLASLGINANDGL